MEWDREKIGLDDTMPVEAGSAEAGAYLLVDQPDLEQGTLEVDAWIVLRSRTIQAGRAFK